MGDFATCTSDAVAIAALPALKPRTDIVQHGSGGPTALEIVGRDPDEWFPKDLPFRPNNPAVPYIYGRCLFEDMGGALETATTEDHRIYILGWSTNKDTVLKGGKTLEYYLTSTKAQIRAMFWDGIVLQYQQSKRIAITQPTSSTWLKDVLNRLPNGGAIIDAKHAQPATHHQKILVVQGSLGVIAFIGGMDIEPNRAVPNPKGTDNPWHDTMVRLTGGTALDCRSVFQERWNDHPDARALDMKMKVGSTVGQKVIEAFPIPEQSQQVPTVTGANAAPPFWTRQVRIGRTYPNLRKTGLGVDYNFASSGIYTAWALIEHAIKAARRWIYLEDQYMVSQMARALLLDKLKQPGFEHLLILMNGSGAVSQDIPFSTWQRNEFRRDLRNADSTERKWGLYTLKAADTPERKQWCGDYMHSKTWVFDDEFAIIGSANCENRGYTLNTEAVAAIGDTRRINAMGQGFARQLRLMLWHKHLGVPHADLQDWTKGLSFWNKPPSSAMIQKSHAFEPDSSIGNKPFPDASERPTVEKAWTMLIDPDAR